MPYRFTAQDRGYRSMYRGNTQEVLVHPAVSNPKSLACAGNGSDCMSGTGVHKRSLATRRSDGFISATMALWNPMCGHRARSRCMSKVRVWGSLYMWRDPAPSLFFWWHVLTSEHLRCFHVCYWANVRPRHVGRWYSIYHHGIPRS